MSKCLLIIIALSIFRECIIFGYDVSITQNIIDLLSNMEPDPPNNSPLSQGYTFTTEGLPTVIAKKVAGLVEELNSDTINLASLKGYLAVGIPDEAAVIREYCWKVVLGYLPVERSKWGGTVEREGKTYEGLVRMFLPEERYPDYPLLLKKDHPRYQELEEDYLLWEQIEKDTSRTHAEFSFFARESREMLLPFLTSARRQKFKLLYGEGEEEYGQFLRERGRQRRCYRYDYMTRILFVYAKLNPKVQYVQGMNEILAPIFYLVNVSKPPHQLEEAACFFMFNNAICDVIELHIKDLDKSRNGIYGKLQEVNQMLRAIDPPVWERMEALKLDPFYYCFRWVTLLYAQDFALFDTIRVWESIFSAHDRPLYINLFAVAILLTSKHNILHNEFSAVLSALHNIRDHLNIHDTIAIADQLYKHHQHTDFGELLGEGKKEKKRRKGEKGEKGEKEKGKKEKKEKKEKKKAQGEAEKVGVQAQEETKSQQPQVKAEKKKAKKQKQKKQKEEGQRQKQKEGGQGQAGEKKGFFKKLVDKYLSK